MLKYIVLEYSVKEAPEEISAEGNSCVSLLTEYKNQLITGGYLCRKNSLLYEDRNRRSIYVSGVLCSASALRDSAEEPKIEELVRKLRDWLEGDVELREYGICPDSHYCEEEEWDGLLLIHSHLFGEPSFRCSSCGGLVATYRLNMPTTLSAQVWTWEREADAISDLSVTCGRYESWSDSQLSNVNSLLNRFGREVASLVSAYLGTEVLYALESGEMKHEICPHCGGALTVLAASQHYRKCQRCNLAFLL